MEKRMSLTRQDGSGEVAGDCTDFAHLFCQRPICFFAVVIPDLPVFGTRNLVWEHLKMGKRF